MGVCGIGGRGAGGGKRVFVVDVGYEENAQDNCEGCRAVDAYGEEDKGQGGD